MDVLLNVILQLVEGVIAFDFYESLKPSSKKLRKFTIIIVSYLVMCGINLLFDYNALVNTIFLALFSSGFTKFLYKHNWCFSIFVGFVFCSCVTVSEFVPFSIFSFVSGKALVDELLSSTSAYILFIIMSKTMLFLLLKILSAFINKFLFKNRVDLLSVIFCANLFMAQTVFVVLTKDFTSPLLSIANFVMFTGIIAACFLQQKLERNYNEMAELRLIKQNQEIDSKYLKILEHQNQNLRVYAHDTKKHLTAIRNLTENEEIIKYLEQMTNELNEYNKVVSSGNRNLDVILNKYITECEIKGIDFEYDVRLTNLKTVEVYDLVTILGNALDNALESAINTTEKKIELKTDYKNNFDVIIIKNSCDKKPNAEDDKLKTTKANKSMHGLGLKSMKNALKKYNGDFYWEYSEEDKMFVLTVMVMRG